MQGGSIAVFGHQFLAYNMVVYENTNSQLYKMKFELHILKN